MNVSEIRKAEVNKVKEVFNPGAYSDFHEAMEALEFLARNRNLSTKSKEVLNRNFYSYLRLIEKEFDLEFSLKETVAKGIAYLAGLSAEEKEMIDLIGDDDKYCLKLLDEGGKYPSTWLPESGKCRFPSHWFSFYHVVMVNEL